MTSFVDSSLPCEQEQFLRADIFYNSKLARFEKEKPYTMRYRHGTFPTTNMEVDKIEKVAIRNMRDLPTTTLDVQGFELLPYESRMAYEDYFNKETVAQIYLPELARKLEERFGAKRVEFVRHTIRARDPEYPIATGKPYNYDQPAQIAHIDITTARAFEIVEKMFGDQLEESPHFIVVNIWKPLKGPLFDWPLAVCDATTTNCSQDSTAADIIWEDEFMENCVAHFSPRHKWYYPRAQTPNDLLVFRQMDSEKEVNNGVIHVAFENPETPPDAPERESIEVQAIMFFGDQVANLKQRLAYPVYKH